MESRTGFSRRLVPALVPSLLSILFLCAAVAGAGEGSAPPKDFRSWAHSKSTVVADKSNPLHGIHNQYVNESALQTLRKGGQYKDGATFVDSVNAVVETNGIYSPGPKAKTLVMIRSQKAGSTGGWVFQAFDPAGKPIKIDPVKDCFECHLNGAKESGFVFHKYAE
ncbi:MAG: cytochrome P460 family protein [Deltaproteobacteria bacterium]|nr:cytochrome P460 family protein [Deltaproteobacteria bacterium]